MTQTTDGLPHRNTYDKYGTQNPIEQKLMDRFMGCLDAAVAELRPSSVLEVGAGEGEVTTRLMSRFPGVPIVAMDLPDEETATHWKERGLLGFFGDMRSLPIADNSMDLVFGIEVLEHVPDPELALRDIARVCSGAVVLSVPREPIWRAANMTRGKYIPEMGNTPGHINHWSKRGFREFVGREFDVDWSASPFPWTMVRGIARS